MTDQSPSQNPAEVYQAVMVPAEFQPWSIELLSRIHLMPGDDVLDVACGTGVVARGAAEIVGPDGTVTGVDVSPAMLDIARALPLTDGGALTFIQGRAEELPFGDAMFDVVLCQQGMQFFSDRPAAVHEMRRVLRQGGRVGVSTWRGPAYQSVKGALVLALQRAFGPTAAVAYSLEDENALRLLFIDAGFRNIRVEAVRRQMHDASAEGMVRMIVMGAAAAVPELAAIPADEREATIQRLLREIEADIAAVQVEDEIAYPMESHILIAAA